MDTRVSNRTLRSEPDPAKASGDERFRNGRNGVKGGLENFSHGPLKSSEGIFDSALSPFFTGGEV